MRWGVHVRILPVVLVALLGACSTPGPALTGAEAERLFHDEVFSPAGPAIAQADVFAPSEAMRLFLEQEAASWTHRRTTAEQLVEALTSGRLGIRYEAESTRDAAKTFDARAGNCLSLVILTAAFAKALQVPVTYQSAILDPAWVRSGRTLLEVDHVNVTLGARRAEIDGGGRPSSLVVDFLPGEDLRGLRTREIAERTVVAMYRNNRAAESLLQGGLDDAYAWAREAVRADPRFLPSLNTLGVVYLRHGDIPFSVATFRAVLGRESENTLVMGNLALALERQGHAGEAAALRERLAKIEPRPPFYYYDRGRSAMERGDYRVARDLFAREVARNEYNHELHFWLALADLQLGELAGAREQLELAKEMSPTDRERDLYAVELARLSALGRTSPR